MSNPTLTEADLYQFTGSEEFYRIPFPIFGEYLYTEGVQYVAQQAGAYWLIEAIMSWQYNLMVTIEPFQHWTLTVAPDRTAKLIATDGDSKQLALQEIPYTDFPLAKISFYLCDKVLLLPGEY